VKDASEEAMNRLRAIFGDERGIAVVVGLVALLALTALVLAFLAVSAFEPQISANLAAATQARYLAEAGIEAAFDGLANTPNWSTALVGATCTTGVVAPGTIANNALAGLTSASGTFTVLVRNDCFAGNGTTSADNILTGLNLDDAAHGGGNGTTDTNSRLILISTGTSGTATRTVKVVVKKVVLPTINGALSFPGVNADVNFSGSSFTIRGIDTVMGSTTSNGTAPPVYGISVGVAANEAGIDTALANNQQNDVSGKSQLDPSTTTTGDGTVAYDNTLTSTAVTDFVNAIKANADITIDSSPSSPYSITGVGGACSTNINSRNCWGTTSHPKVVYVRGNPPDNTTQFSALSVSGTSTGTGILIVENGDVDITGNFNWNGPIILTGTNVKLRYHGGGNESVWGAVIINELNNNGSTNLEADISGNAKIYYSTQALNLVMSGLNGRRLQSLYSWQEQ
jgi:Tfp pilus assembly protein PilX